jgi:putative DNA-invertase from lambdoid prophage Rac
MQCAVRDALIAFVAAKAQAQAEATKSAQRAGIDHARQQDPRAYRGRRPAYTRDQLVRVLAIAPGTPIAQSARDIGLSRQAVYRLQANPVQAEATLQAWGL